MTQVSEAAEFVIRTAAEDDVPLVLALIKELAEYERMADQRRGDRGGCAQVTIRGDPARRGGDRDAR